MTDNSCGLPDAVQEVTDFLLARGKDIFGEEIDAETDLSDFDLRPLVVAAQNRFGVMIPEGEGIATVADFAGLILTLMAPREGEVDMGPPGEQW